MATLYSQEWFDQNYSKTPQSIYDSFTKVKVNKMLEDFHSDMKIKTHLKISSGLRLQSTGSDHQKGFAADLSSIDQREIFLLWLWMSGGKLHNRGLLFDKYGIRGAFLSIHNYHLHLTFNPMWRLRYGYEIKNTPEDAPYNIKDYDVIEDNSFYGIPDFTTAALRRKAWDYYKFSYDWEWSKNKEFYKDELKEWVGDKIGDDVSIAGWSIMGALLVLLGLFLVLMGAKK